MVGTVITLAGLQRHLKPFIRYSRPELHLPTEDWVEQLPLDSWHGNTGAPNMRPIPQGNTRMKSLHCISCGQSRSVSSPPQE